MGRVCHVRRPPIIGRYMTMHPKLLYYAPGGRLLLIELKSWHRNFRHLRAASNSAEQIPVRRKIFQSSPRIYAWMDDWNNTWPSWQHRLEVGNQEDWGSLADDVFIKHLRCAHVSACYCNMQIADASLTCWTGIQSSLNWNAIKVAYESLWGRENN